MNDGRGRAAAPGPSGPEDRPVAPEQDVAALRAELERMRHTHALAVAQHLWEQLVVRGEHVADLRATLAALLPAPVGSHA
ncbi:hypothetical protein [Streptomyces sp. NPDC057418]|uniref:hypothetical protein n=1 Tax=Streptomyces sp. NPDC057418 TaxID=3346126 RepID=UPI0036C8B262